MLIEPAKILKSPIKEVFHKVRYDFVKEAQKLPRVVQRYGGKGRMYRQYEPYIRKMALDAKANTFVDCFGGGGSMSMAALLMFNHNTYNPIFDHVIYNDIDIGVYSLFRVVKDKDSCEELVEKILKTKYSEKVFNQAKEELKKAINKDITSSENKKEIIEIAYYQFIASAMSYNSIGTNFRNYTAYNTVSSDYEDRMYRQAVLLREITPLLGRLEITSKDYKEVIQQTQARQDRRCVYFMDPPYVLSTRATEEGYTFNFSDVAHIELIEILTGYVFSNDSFQRSSKYDGMNHWMMCGYQDDVLSKQALTLYSEMEKLNIQPNVKKVSLGIHNRPSGGKQMTKDDPEEILWYRM